MSRPSGNMPRRRPRRADGKFALVPLCSRPTAALVAADVTSRPPSGENAAVQIAPFVLDKSSQRALCRRSTRETLRAPLVEVPQSHRNRHRDRRPPVRLPSAEPATDEYLPLGSASSSTAAAPKRNSGVGRDRLRIPTPRDRGRLTSARRRGGMLPDAVGQLAAGLRIQQPTVLSSDAVIK